MTDQDLLLRIQKQDAEALSKLYDRYHRLVYGFLLGMLKDTDESEDALQDVFVLIWKKSVSYREELGTPKNWIVRIAHNRAVNILRSRRIRMQQAEVEIPDENAAEGRSVLAQISEDSLWESTVRNEESGIIHEAILILPDDQKTLVDLAFFQGYSHSEIAEQTGIPLGTVKTRIRTGLRILREHLGSLKDELI